MVDGYMICIYVAIGIIILAILFVVLRRARISRARERRYFKAKQAQIAAGTSASGGVQQQQMPAMASPTPDLLGTVYASQRTPSTRPFDSNMDNISPYSTSSVIGTRQNRGVGGTLPCNLGSDRRLNYSPNKDVVNNATDGEQSGKKRKRSYEITAIAPLHSPYATTGSTGLITFDTAGRTQLVNDNLTAICKVTPIAHSVASAYNALNYDDYNASTGLINAAHSSGDEADYRAINATRKS